MLGVEDEVYPPDAPPPCTINAPGKRFSLSLFASAIDEIPVMITLFIAPRLTYADNPDGKLSLFLYSSAV